MPSYRTTICQDKGFSNGMYYYAPIDMRKKFYFCDFCQGKHLVKEGVIKEEVIKKKEVKKMKKPSSELCPVLILEEAIESLDIYINDVTEQMAKANEAVIDAQRRRTCLVEMVQIHLKQPGEGRITC